jgi:hypothetical protein
VLNAPSTMGFMQIEAGPRRNLLVSIYKKELEMRDLLKWVYFIAFVSSDVIKQSQFAKLTYKLFSFSLKWMQIILSEASYNLQLKFTTIWTSTHQYNVINSSKQPTLAAISWHERFYHTWQKPLTFNKIQQFLDFFYPLAEFISLVSRNNFLAAYKAAFKEKVAFSS